MTDGYVGIVRDGEFDVLWSTSGMRGKIGLTSFGMQVAQPLEGGRIDLTDLEGQALLVQGHPSGEWICSAKIVDQGGPLLAAIVEAVFGAKPPIDLADTP